MKVFISHASKDKPFVRKLDAALVSNGINTFLDERDIRVGDSIPDSIYRALEDSTHIIYVISRNSVNSKWVAEELAVAKMRAQSEHGVKILPCVIDDVDVPTSVLHIKYCMCLKWYEYGEFAHLIKQILDALGVSLKQPENMESAFYIGNYILFNDAEIFSGRISSVLHAAKLFDHYFMYDDNRGSGRFMSKMMIKEYDIDVLNALIAGIHSVKIEESNMLTRMAEKIGELLDCIYLKRGGDFVIALSDLARAEKVSQEVFGMIQDFRMKAIEPILSGYSS